jgi:membrane protease subunit HflK
MPEQWEDPEEEIKDLLDSVRNRLKNRLHLPSTAVFVAAVSAFLAMALLTSVYTVKPEEKAVILRLGRYTATHGPGLHVRLPFGIDQLFKVATETIHQEEFGFRSGGDSNEPVYGHRLTPQEESAMLTGDLNVAEVGWIVQYKISDPKKYLFNTRERIKNMRDVSQSVLRRVVGDREVSEVLTTGRVEIAEEAHRFTQEVLDRYDMGVKIVTIKLQDANPPESVKPAFNEVNAAKQEQEKAINQAEREYNQVIPEAQGKAEQLIRDAEGYSKAVVNRSQGDASRFKNVLSAYRTAPAVTKTRLHREALEELYGRFKEVIIVDKNVNGLLPIYQNLQGQTGEKR